MHRPSRSASRFVAAVLWALWTAVVHAAPPPPLSPQDEARALRLARGSSAFAQYWLDYVQPYQFAAEILKRSALLSRCKAFARGIDSLDPDQRHAVERILRAQETQRRSVLGPSDGPGRNRLWLIQVASLPSQERTDLLFLAEGALGQLTVRAFSEATVMHQFAGLSRDLLPDRVEPYAVVWLTGYFDASGRRAALREAVSREAPELLPDLDRVSTADTLRPGDAAWLTPLTQALASRADRIRTALLAGYPPVVLDEAQRLLDFQWRVAASEDLAITPPGSPQWEALRDTSEALYPEPAGARQLRFGNGMYLPARAELPRFCPSTDPASSPSL
jgi:hypothetical protein